MFTAKMNGKTLVLKRSLTFPAAGALTKTTIEDELKIPCDFDTVDPKSDVGKAISTAFPKVLVNDLNASRKKYDDGSIALWSKVGVAAANGNIDAVKLKKAAAEAEKKIAERWNTYYKKVAQPAAQKIFQNVAESQAKKAKESIPKAKLQFSAPALKTERVGILSSLLGALTLGVSTGGLGWLVTGLGALGPLSSGASSMWKLGKKRSSDLQDCLNQIDDGLDTALATIKDLGPSLEVLTRRRDDFAAQIIVAKSELAKAEKELAALEIRAKTEKAVKEGKYLGQLRKIVENKGYELEALRKTVLLQDDLLKKVRAAHLAVEAAGKEVTARRKGVAQVAQRFEGVRKDIETAMSAAGKFIKTL